jgi:fatty-acyl-CoA synthase
VNPLRGLCTGEALDWLAAQHGDRIGLRFGGTAWTFRQIRNEIDLVSGRLAGLDLPPNSPVALWMPNRPEFLWYWMGAAQMGLMPVVLNTRLKRPEARYQLAQSRSVAVIVPGRCAHRDFLQDALAMRAEDDGAVLPALKHVLTLERGATQGSPIVLDELAPVPSSPRAVDPDAGALVIYTSGTTALPKGAVISHRIWRKAWDIAEIGRNTADDRLYLPVPLFSSMAMLNGVLPFWVRGACVHLYERFDARECVAAARDEGVTALHLLPAMVTDLLALGPFTTPPLASVRIGLALMNDSSLMARAEDELGIQSVVAGYGMTETLTLISRPLPEDSREARHTTQGRALPDVELAIRDPATGATLAAGELGEICIRGYSLMQAYFDKPAETAASFSQDGWFRSGDAGWLDKDGRLIFQHRLGDSYKSRGFNVSAAEVERVLMEHPAVEMAAVVAIPDQRDSARGVAFIKLQSESAASEQDLLLFVKDRLAGYKQPRHIMFIDVFPVTAGTAKIQKYRLREMALLQMPDHNEALG